MDFYFKLLASRRLLVTLLLGFSSGLPLALTAGTLQAWLTVDGVDLVTLGFLSLVGLPYTYKFLWAPLLDRYVPPWLGRRRGWLLVTQLGLLGALAVMAGFTPSQDIYAVGTLAVVVAFLSASQDIAVDAYRTELLEPAERGLGAACSVAAYRIAMLTSGGGALVLADAIGWQRMYGVMAGLMVIGMSATLFGPEPRVAATPPATLGTAIRIPFKEFLTRPAAGWILLLLVLYKLGDAFTGALGTAFLLRGVGFSAGEVGLYYKSFGLIATLAGAFLGGALMLRLGLYRALLLFGVLQAVTNLAFYALALAGKNYGLLIGAVTTENLAGGMGTAAFVALLMALCDVRYTATQYALLSALAAVGRVYVGPVAGQLAQTWGWPAFFLFSFVAALPGLVLLHALRGRILALGR